MAVNLAVPMKEYAMGTPWMWPRRSGAVHRSRSEKYSNDSWEERAFAEDTGGGHMGEGSIWPPRSYSCTFCRREFRSAQALGGHMNVHRRDRALLRQSCLSSGINYSPESDTDLNSSSDSALGNVSDHHHSHYPSYSSNNSLLYRNNLETIISTNHPSPYPPPLMYLYCKSDALGSPSDRPAIPSTQPPSAGPLLSISSCNGSSMHLAPPFYSFANVSDEALTVNAVDIFKESSDSTGGVVSEVVGSSMVTDWLFKDNKEGKLQKLRLGAALRSRAYDPHENVSDAARRITICREKQEMPRLDAARRITICREKQEMPRLDAMEDSTDDDLDLELRLGERPPQAHPK